MDQMKVEDEKLYGDLEKSIGSRKDACRLGK
jgi:hypothetical protein